MNKLPIETENKLFGKYLYPEAKEIKEHQQKVNWLDIEIPVEDDKQDYLVIMDEYQLNLAKVTLQSFVEIEQSVGDIWHTIGIWFPHSEIEGACAVIESMEKGVHAFFYQKMSDVLRIDPEETYRIQNELGPIRNKLEYMKDIFSNPDKNKPLTLAVVTTVEQVLLFGNFAMLKSFKANGNNLITNTLFGVDYVIADESIHGDFSKYLFQTYLSEANYSKDKIAVLLDKISIILNGIVQHEEEVIELVFKDVNTINGVTEKELKSFIKHRANMVIDNLGIDIPKYTVCDNSIEQWFYTNINALKLHDFFAGSSTSYRRDWSEKKFTRFKGCTND